jgi:hypothetical protein
VTRVSYDEARCKAAIEHMARAIVRPRILRYSGSDTLSISAKTDRSVVTQADVEIEREIRGFPRTNSRILGIDDIAPLARISHSSWDCAGIWSVTRS